MAKRTVNSPGLVGWLALTGVLLTILLFVAAPLSVVVSQAIQGGRPSGFGRGLSSLALLASRSVFFAAVPTLAVATACVCLSGFSCFSKPFRRFYRLWLLILLFTNPVFFVFGFTVLLARMDPSLAVGLATMYIQLPLVGLMIQSAVEEYPSELISTARLLGSSPVGAIGRHVVPAIASSIFAAVILGSVNALGFYLVPSFVGQGHVSTLATAIDHAVNHIGDWQAACQLAVVALATQLVLLASAGGIRWAWTSSILGWRS